MGVAEDKDGYAVLNRKDQVRCGGFVKRGGFYTEVIGFLRGCGDSPNLP